MNALKYAIFASGSGSNALSLIKTGEKEGSIPAFIFLNNSKASLIDKIPQNIPYYVIECDHPRADPVYDEKVIKLCKEYNIEWVFLAGFMKILGSHFLEHFKDQKYHRVINIHPSLLPKYKGLNAYERCFNAGDLDYGHSVHLVDKKIDHGEVLLQRSLKRMANDDLQSFKRRGLKFENKDYSYLLKNILTHGSVFIDDCLKKPMKFTQELS